MSATDDTDALAAVERLKIEYESLQDRLRDHPHHGSPRHFKELVFRAYLTGLIDADHATHLFALLRVILEHRQTLIAKTN